MMHWHNDPTRPPWCPLDNRLRRAQWAARYYAQYKPGQHPTKEQGKPESASTADNRLIGWKS